MPTPRLYASLARFVGRHRAYFLSVGVGGFVALFALAGLLAALKIEIPDWSFSLFWFGAWFVGIHWPFLIAWQWFHPRSRARARGIFEPPLPLLAAFLTLFFVVSFTGPLLAYFLPPSASLQASERAAQQDVAD